MAVGKLDEQSRKALDELIQLSNPDTALKSSINKFLKRVKKNLEKYDFVASGNLFQSIKSLPTVKREGILTARIEIADYWEKLETGTPAKGFTKEKRKDLQPKILQWIKTKDSLLAIATNDKERKSLSYAIATNILKKGTIKRFNYKGKKFLTDELPQLEKDFIEEFSKPEE